MNKKKALEVLSFVYHYRQYSPYYLWNSNLNSIYDSLFLSYRPVISYFSIFSISVYT
ncbi:hypothetical protein OIU84_027274 [Salix udensis]|uniref:Uncharacterized protein n=1 Tax=Salix udensis TaxID=889485 RepID=A0AAD6KF17_9ROSI|nr:hypothetical protein OIU84_027274 [Salix udensis]